MNILVSACLLGVCCRYDGKSRPHDGVIALGKKHRLIPVCPETAGGLPTPRPACEIVGDRVISVEGIDRTEQYRKGAASALKTAQKFGCKYAVLKLRSPACGVNAVYDGSFTGTLAYGKHGVAAALLLENGIFVLGEDMLSQLPEEEL